MKINTDQIEKFLKQSKIPYRWVDYREDSYEIASIFSPVEKGFYFFSGDANFILDVKNSLIMVSDTYVGGNFNNNCFIKLEDSRNPQLVFYELLATLFKRISTGKISELTSINSNAILGENVQIDSFATLENCKIGNNVIIGSNVVIHSGTEIGENVVIEAGSVIGAQGVSWTWNEDQSAKIIQPQLGGVLIESNCFLGANTIIVRGSLNENTFIGQNSLLAPGCRLGHGTQIGEFCHLANNVTTGGNTVIGSFSFIGSGAIFRPKVKIHSKTIVGAGALVLKNTIEKNKTLKGVPAKEFQTNDNPSGMPKPKL